MNREQAIQLIRESAFAGHVDLLAKHLMPSARIWVQDDAEGGTVQLGMSHFGGLPSLTRETAWPLWDKRPFLNAQISRYEDGLKGTPLATGLQDVCTRMREEMAGGPVPLVFLGQLYLSEIHAVAPLPGWPSEGSLAFFL